MTLTSNAEARPTLQRGDSEIVGLQIDHTDPNCFTIRLSGVWRLHHGMPNARQLEQELTSPSPPRIAVDGSGLATWDSSLVNFLTGLTRICHARHITLDRSGLPEGLNRLVDLASTNTDSRELSVAAPESLLARTGRRMLARLEAVGGY